MPYINDDPFLLEQHYEHDGLLTLVTYMIKRISLYCRLQEFVSQHGAGHQIVDLITRYKKF